jgi:hypothetical protein
MNKKNDALEKAIYTLEYIAHYNPQFRAMAYDTINQCQKAIQKECKEKNS